MATILIMEDDADQATLLSALLSKSGHEATVSRDAKEAWRMLIEKPYDVLLTDMSVATIPGLPHGGGGLSLIGKMRASRPADAPPWIAGVRIVAISGMYGIVDNVLNMAGILGADACLRKPARIEDILQAIEPGTG